MHPLFQPVTWLKGSLLIEIVFLYCGGYWRGSGWQTETVEYLHNRFRRINGAESYIGTNVGF
jgi:hypothetical protein